MTKNGFKKDLLALLPCKLFVSFSKKLKINYTWQNHLCKFSFLKNSPVQINSKLNSKPYDYLYKFKILIVHFI